MTSPSQAEFKNKVLVVDDSPEVRRLIGLYLRDIPCNTIFANNGIEAISACRKDPDIRMIFLDMEMPVMDGYTAARILRSEIALKEIPIIAMTAHEGEDAVKACIRAGCTAYLNKPVSRDELLRLVTGGISGSPEEDDGTTTGGTVYIDPDIAEIVPGFLANRSADTERINDLLEISDLDQVRIIGHSMAGSAGGYGFPEIGRLGKKIEEAALDRDIGMIRECNSRLSEYLRDLKYRVP